MLYTYSTTAQTLSADEKIIFNTNAIQTGCTATHISGTSEIKLNKCGYYMIHFNADGANQGTAGNIVVQMYGNGVLVPSAEATNYSSATTDIENIGFTVLVQVEPNKCCNTSNVPYVLTFVNTGVETQFTNVAVTVTKVA